MKLAIVHDYLNQMGGAEQVLRQLHSLYPEAPVFTSIFDKDKMPADFSDLDIHTSFMQYLPLVFKFFKYYLPLYPKAFESLNLKGFEVILSSSSAFAKGARKPVGATHFCYCHTPARFLWLFHLYAQREEFNPLIKLILPALLAKQKEWDIKNSKQVDYFIANSKNVALRIKEFYGRDSVVINPPINTSLFKPRNEQGNFFLVVSRLNTYKRIDVVVRTFNQLGLPLKIIGEGPDRQTLETMAKDNIEFLGALPERELADYYAACKALIFPGEEDFGMVPLEAMASGRPVIAYAKGGALETVVPGSTGVFFAQQETASLLAAIEEFEKLNFDLQKIRKFAEGFDQEIFKQKIKDFINEKTG